MKIMAIQHNRIAFAAAVLFLPVLAAVIGGELGPASGEPHIWDKLLHLLAYFILSGLATTAWPSWKRTGLAILGLIAVGGALELLQGMVGRDMSIRDELANTLGVIAGVVVASAVRALLVRFGRAD